MNDYAAAPIQPIAQGLITLIVIDDVAEPFFDGVGISDIIRTPAGSVPAPLANGDFLLTLDEGLPGDVALESYKGRVLLTLRGGSSGPTTITETAVLYPVLPDIFPDAPLAGSQIRVITSIAGVGVDPDGLNASGLEIIVWRGVQASIPGFNANLNVVVF